MGKVEANENEYRNLNWNNDLRLRNDEENRDVVNTEKEPTKLSQMIISKMNKVYNQLEEQVVNVHNKVVDATGVGDSDVYRKAADTLVMTKAKAVSLITSAATSIDASTNGAIPSYIRMGTERVDDAFEAAK